MQKLNKPLRMLLTASTLMLVFGCGCFPKLPDIRPKQIIQRLNICKQYVATFGDELTFKFERDLPLSECIIDGNFILTETELVDIRRTYNEAKSCYDSQNCKPENNINGD